ncbi:MAG: sulfotransferase domain-containing protein [Candidatus Paceibacterota bacterium]
MVIRSYLHPEKWYRTAKYIGLGSGPFSREYPEMHRNRFAEVMIVSYPKSGRSWLRMIISAYVAALHGKPLDHQEDITDLRHQISDIPHIVFVHDGSTYAQPINVPSEELNADKTAFETKKVVLLVRDPRDVLVSYYFHCTHRQKVFEGTLSDFIRDDRFGIRKLITFLNHWNNAQKIPASFTLLRYEDMSSDTYHEMVRLINILGLPLKEEALTQAIAFSAFDNMKKRERSGELYIKGRFGAGETKDEQSYKVRQGKVGGYKDALQPDDIKYLNDQINNFLSPFFGYHTKD